MKNLEKFLFKKISVWILLLVLLVSIVIIILFGSLVLRSTTAKKIALIPEILSEIIFGKTEDFVVGRNKFDKTEKFIKFSDKAEDLSGYLLLSRYDYKKKRSTVELLNIETGKILHTWNPNINKINSYSKLPVQQNLHRDHNISRYQINHPLLMNNGDLLIHSTGSPLVKITACSKMKWFVDKAFHHSIELDYEKNIWSPAKNFPPTIKGLNLDLDRRDEKIFEEDTIEQVSQNGKIIFSKPIIEILIDNKLEYMLPPGWQVALSPDYLDPVHLNDIQPTLYNSKYWKKGDVFISLRNISLIFLYRPSTNKIIWYKQGPWIFQHDVDVINDHQIMVFNNNLDDLFKANTNETSETLIYDFEKNEITSPYKVGYSKNNIKTTWGGLSEILSNGDIFVEETLGGRILRMDKQGNVKWQFVNREKNGKLYLLNWSRFLEQDLYSSVVNKITTIKCNEK